MFLFRPTDTQVCRFVPVVDDNIALEGNESFAVSVTGTSPGVDGTPEETTTTTTEVITIIDNDGKQYQLCITTVHVLSVSATCMYQSLNIY